MASNELELGYGVRLTNPAPVEAIRTKPQVGQAPALGYASVAEACALVAPAVRCDGLTVMVTGVGEYWWQAPDLSDAGLKPKGGGNNSSGGAADGILFISDTQAILSPDRQDQLAAGQLYWLVLATGQTPPVVVPPVTTQRTMVRLADAGVKNDGVITNQQASGGTDNAPALMAVQAQYTAGAFREQAPVELIMPEGGVVAYAAGQDGDTNMNKWGLGYYDLKLTLQGATLIPRYSGTDNFFTAFLYRGEMLQNNRKAYRGTKSYFNCPRIATVAAGESSITARNPADIADETLYAVGKRVCVYSKEVVLGEEAYPPSTKHNETPRIITAINRTTGVMQLDKPLEYEHRADWPENPQTSGGGGGQGRIVPLDAPGNEYPEYFEVDGGGGTLKSSSASSPGSFGWIANNLFVHDVTLTNGATVTETLSSARFLRMRILGEFEGDKVVCHVEFTDVEVGFCSNFGGVRAFTMTGGKSHDSLQVAPPKAVLDGVECYATPFTTDSGTKQHPNDSAVAPYPGFHYTKLRLNGLKLGATPESGASSYLNPADYRTVTVTSVNGQDAEFDWDGTSSSPANFIWRGAQIGTRFYTLDGAKVGYQTQETKFTGATAACTSGKFAVTITGFTPAVGDVLEFSSMLTIEDANNHTILTPTHPARLWGMENLVWKGNQSPTGLGGSVTVNKADLLFKNGGTVAYMALRAKPSRITVTGPAGTGRMLLVAVNKALQSSSAQELVSFNLADSGARFVGAAGASEGMSPTNSAQVGLNQYRPARFGGPFAYALAFVLDGATYDQVSSALTITIEYDPN